MASTRAPKGWGFDARPGQNNYILLNLLAPDRPIPGHGSRLLFYMQRFAGPYRRPYGNYSLAPVTNWTLWKLHLNFHKVQ